MIQFFADISGLASLKNDRFDFYLLGFFNRRSIKES